MNNKQVSVTILFQAKPGMEEMVRKEMMQLISPVIAEVQCINVNLHQDPDDRTRFMLYENWADKNYFIDEHMQTSHMQTYFKKSEEFLAEPPRIIFWELLSENVGAHRVAQQKDNQE